MPFSFNCTTTNWITKHNDKVGEVEEEKWKEGDEEEEQKMKGKEKEKNEEEENGIEN